MRLLLLAVLIFAGCSGGSPRTQQHSMKYERGDKVMLKLEVPAVILRVYPHENKYRVRVFTQRHALVDERIYAFEIDKKADE